MEPKIEVRRLTEQPSEDETLYRYVTIDKLMDFLINARITLTQLRNVEDRLEGTTIPHLLLNLKSQRHEGFLNALTDNTFTFQVAPDRRNEFWNQREDFQRLNYVSCWYVDNHESVAMWQLYSRRDSVAIRIPFKDLDEQLSGGHFEPSVHRIQSLKYGKVQYAKFSDREDVQQLSDNTDLPGFFKDRGYQHEREFRLLLSMENREAKKIEQKRGVLIEHTNRMGRYLNIRAIHLALTNFQSMPFEIVFHPQCPDWHRKNVVAILGKWNLRFRAQESMLKDMFQS